MCKEYITLRNRTIERIKEHLKENGVPKDFVVKLCSNGYDIKIKKHTFISNPLILLGLLYLYSKYRECYRWDPLIPRNSLFKMQDGSYIVVIYLKYKLIKKDI